MIRSHVSAALKHLGFDAVDVVPTLESGLHRLEVESFDWVFCELALKEKVNIFHLLKTCRDEASLSTLKVSLLSTKDDQPYLGKCFELGAFTFHDCQQNQEQITLEVQTVLTQLENQKGDYRQVSAEYVRKILIDQEHYQDLLDFETSLVREYTGNAENMLMLSKAQLLIGNVESAKKTLAQACLIDGFLQDRADALLKEFSTADNLDLVSEEGAVNVLDIDCAVVIEPSIEVAKRIAGVLKNLGVPKVKLFKNPFSAFNYATKRECPDLIISEWALPKFPAPILLQRLMDRVEEDIPTIVYNKDFTTEDVAQLQEMGVDGALATPFEDEELMRQMLWVFQEQQNTFSVAGMKKKIRQALINENFEKADHLFEEFRLSHGDREADLLVLEAERFYAKHDYEEARRVALDALQKSANTLEALTVLGRSLINLKDFDAGLKCLESASKMSPYSVARLCSIAEGHLKNRDHGKFEKSLNQAKRINPNNRAVKKLEVVAALRSKQTEKAKELMGNLPDLNNVIKFTNNKAIALIQCERFEEGIRTYQEAIEALPDKHLDLKAVVQYNLGLAYARHDDLGKAIKTLKSASQSVASERRKKIIALLNKIKTAKAKGIKVNIPALKPLNDSDTEDILQKIHADLDVFSMIPPMELCCYKIFKHQQSRVSIESYLENPPRFVIRDAIKKEYALGFEKHLRASA